MLFNYQLVATTEYEISEEKFVVNMLFNNQLLEETKLKLVKKSLLLRMFLLLKKIKKLYMWIT